MRLVLIIVCFILFACNALEDADLEKNNATEVNLQDTLVTIPVNNSINDLKDKVEEENFEPNTYAYLTTLINDTLKVPINEEGVCFNHSLDSLTKVKVFNSFQLMDLTNSIVLINWNVFLGTLKVDKLAPKKYSFTGSANFPVNGDWAKSFAKFNIIQYILEINTEEYIVYRENSVRLKLPYNSYRLESMQNKILRKAEYFSDSWDIPEVDFSIVKQYEYDLFSAVINGVSEYIEDYATLRETIAATNIGEFSEYLEGNYHLLRLYGILNDDNYDFSMLKHLYSVGDTKVCY